MTGDRWLRCLRPLPEPGVRLVCFPHAGGAASFFLPWAEALPEGVELLAVRYPGRQDRIAEPFAATMEELVDALTPACAPLLDRPVVFFGHSMGASVAYEVAVRLAADRSPGVALLCVSSRHGPGAAPPRRFPAHVDDEEFVARLLALGGTEQQALAHPELRRLILPGIRADYRLLETYEPSAVTLPSLVVGYYGTSDQHVPEPAVRAWETVAGSGFDLRPFEGDHFYLKDCWRDLGDDIATRLFQAPDAGGPVEAHPLHALRGAVAEGR